MIAKTIISKVLVCQMLKYHVKLHMRVFLLFENISLTAVYSFIVIDYVLLGLIQEILAARIFDEKGTAETGRTKVLGLKSSFLT